MFIFRVLINMSKPLERESQRRINYLLQLDKTCLIFPLSSVIPALQSRPNDVEVDFDRQTEKQMDGGKVKCRQRQRKVDLQESS